VRRRARAHDTVPNGVLASRFRARGVSPSGGRTDCKPMKRIGSHSFGEFLPSTASTASVAVEPEANRRDGLVARFGTDIALPSLLVALRSAA
jgi:hypothetical protein